MALKLDLPLSRGQYKNLNGAISMGSVIVLLNIPQIDDRGRRILQQTSAMLPYLIEE